MSQPKRMDYFNTIAGLVLAQLYEQFPIETQVDEAAIADAMGVTKTDQPVDPQYRHVYGGYAAPLYDYDALPSGDPFLKVVWATLRWLREEGFIRARGDAATEDVVLTAAALDAMNKAPAGLGPSVGAKLTDAAKNVGSEAGKSAMSGAVGELVGGFVKGLFT